MKYKFDEAKFREYYEKGLTDVELGKLLNVSSSTICAYRNKHNLLFNRNKVNLSDFQKEMIIGCMLGDSSLAKANRAKIRKIQSFPFLVLCHSTKQTEYFLHKYELLKELNNSYTISDRLRKQNNTVYTEIRNCPKTSVSLLEFYHLFYENGKKIIRPELYDKITAVSLAYWYMDDGTKADVSCNLCTQGFSREEVNFLRKILFEKFNIETTINLKNVIRIRKKSLFDFIKLIEPYVHETMKYKLNQ
jgi:hypothetical protein